MDRVNKFFFISASDYGRIEAFTLDPDVSVMRPDQAFNLDSGVSVLSLVTRQKAAAAKQLIENHYKNYLQGLQDWKQRKAAEAKFLIEEEEQLLRNLEKKETEYMRLQRRKIGIDDFELLTLIGKVLLRGISPNLLNNIV
ncbi:putative non-specific serine/threonine protein kinase [Helianthus debilis subsp. tardiflorus]